MDFSQDSLHRDAQVLSNLEQYFHPFSLYREYTSPFGALGIFLENTENRRVHSVTISVYLEPSITLSPTDTNTAASLSFSTHLLNALSPTSSQFYL